MSDSLTITREWFALLESLPTVQSRWNVLYAVSRFAFDGVKPDGLNPVEKSVFMIMKTSIQDRARKVRYITKVRKNRLQCTSTVDASQIEGKPSTVDVYSRRSEMIEQNLFNIKEDQENNLKDITMDSSRDLKENRVKESPKQKRKIFVPPTLEQVREYAIERNSPADPEEFYSYHSANGWMIGRAKMVDWKKAFVYWERKEFNRARRRNSPPPRDYSGI